MQSSVPGLKGKNKNKQTNKQKKKPLYVTKIKECTGKKKKFGLSSLRTPSPSLLRDPQISYQPA